MTNNPLDKYKIDRLNERLAKDPELRKKLARIMVGPEAELAREMMRRGRGEAPDDEALKKAAAAIAAKARSTPKSEPE